MGPDFLFSRYEIQPADPVWRDELCTGERGGDSGTSGGQPCTTGAQPHTPGDAQPQTGEGWCPGAILDSKLPVYTAAILTMLSFALRCPAEALCLL